MKKLLLLFLFCCMGIMPVFSADWQQIGEKSYVDISNITPYKNLYGRNNLNSVWLKRLNNGELKDKQIWYSILMYICDCDNKEISIKMITDYNFSNKVAFTYSYADALMEWNPFIPESLGNAIWDYACYNSQKQKNNTANFKIRYRK